MGVASIPAFCDLDKGLHLQPGGMTHGGDLDHYRGIVQQGDLYHAWDHCVGQTGNDGHGRAHLDHDQCPLKTGTDLAAIHPDLSQLLQRRSLACGQKTVKGAGGDHALSFQVGQMQSTSLSKGGVGGSSVHDTLRKTGE